MPLNDVQGSITVTDNNGNQHTINAEDLDFQEVERHEREMGPEVIYTGEVQAEDSSWSATVQVTEYPLGQQEGDEDIETDNCTAQSNLTFNFQVE
ncbi:MAG: hypothetical protein CMC96_07985 [Flavobacteriales bacterium]|jgi:hypothetical protein|nr:hypothetical protein [Flavobacteriales bacterium]|tara:strand:- start:645 stop:929 length:285 start_codon:yes stop_codon:yes gene_type:complete